MDTLRVQLGLDLLIVGYYSEEGWREGRICFEHSGEVIYDGYGEPFEVDVIEADSIQLKSYGYTEFGLKRFEMVRYVMKTDNDSLYMYTRPRGGSEAISDEFRCEVSILEFEKQRNNLTDPDMYEGFDAAFDELYFSALYGCDSAARLLLLNKADILEGTGPAFNSVKRKYRVLFEIGYGFDFLRSGVRGEPIKYSWPL